MAAIIQIAKHASEIPTEWDGQYLVEYHPRRQVKNLIRCYLVTTPDPAKAKRFPNMEAAETARWVARGTLPGGKPDCPLAAFTITILEVAQ